MIKNIFTAVLFLLSFSVFCQNGHIKGVVKLNGKPEAIVSVLAEGNGVKKGVSTKKDGRYNLELPAGTYELMLSSLGLKTIRQNVVVKANEETVLNFDMEEDVLGLDEVVVTASQKMIPQYVAPVVVSRISTRTFEATQSLSLSEGLKFTPGLRPETNCQNCGFNQLRINGLDGSYSQILINNRAVFSALAGVYALEMYPVNMIDRIEVVRGSGSALYGGNAIGGTVNILTKDPTENSLSLGTNLAFLDGKTADQTAFANTSVVSENFDKGMVLFAYKRNRKPYDNNGDGFSEITNLRSGTIGADMFWNTSERSKIKLNLNAMDEFRRGGNLFDLQPHEAEITEQLEHKIYGGDMSYEMYSENLKHKLAYYASLQKIERKSYYGGGLGRMITSEDDFKALSQEEKDTYFDALNAYGNSRGVVGIGGIQYNYEINNKVSLALGTEYKYDEVKDDTKRKGRIIDQSVKTFGSYGQVEYKPINVVTFLLGARYDYIDIEGDYTFSNTPLQTKKKLNKFVPRVTGMWDMTKDLKLRVAYSQGYKAPQAFDEDLHTEVLGGEPAFIELSSDLKPEKSNSYTASLNYTKKEGNVQVNLILEGFLNRIENSFVNEAQNDILNGIRRRLKQNAEGNLTVAGVNAEANFAFGNSVIWQIGGTYSKGKFSEEQEIYSNDNMSLKSKDVMRTPDLYGFTTLTYKPNGKVSFSYSAVYTGKMQTLHERVEQIKTTPDFFEQNIKGSYVFSLSKDLKLEFTAGVQNIFNAYQKDFDKGPERDANYIYGPQRPRTYFVGATFKM